MLKILKTQTSLCAYLINGEPVASMYMAVQALSILSYKASLPNRDHTTPNRCVIGQITAAFAQSAPISNMNRMTKALVTSTKNARH